MRRAAVTGAMAAAVAGCLAACGAAGRSPARSRAAFVPLPPSVKQARTRGAVSVFPLPGTETASPRTEISFRGLAPARLGRIRVVGSRSGVHAGRFAPHRDGAGASFIPARPFTPGERVTVTTHLHVRGGPSGRFGFTVARPVAEPLTPPPAKELPPSPVETYATEPGLHISKVSVIGGSAARAAPGLVFLGQRRGAGDNGVEILQPNGEPVWFHRIPAGLQATDFREQTYRGRPVLTWWQGKLGPGYGSGEGEIVDAAYRPVATVHAGDGYSEDLHELELTSAGTALVTAFQPVRWNLSSVGGPADGVVLDCVVQEVEVGTGRVLFEWHSLGNVPLSSSYAPMSSGKPYDYFHVNSITSDAEGDLLVSSRATHTIYELDALTGRIHWRMGGKHSDFSMGAGTSFHSQHDAKWIDGSTLTVFDNGAGVGGNNHKLTRGLVLHVDRSARTVRLVQALPQPLGKLFPSQGDVQLLPNGDWFVGWGEGPYATEFAHDGTVLLDLRLTSGSSYRAYHFPWHATPTTQPKVVAKPDGSGRTRVAMSWNGATEIASWQVLAGASAGSLSPVQTVPNGGFETVADVSAAGAYVQVRALDADGNALGFSSAVAVSS